jgi:hypothetical protein
MIQINFTEDELDYMRELIILAAEEIEISENIYFQSIFDKFMSAS